MRLGNTLLKYDLLSPETKKVIHALCTRLKIIADTREKMKGVMDGIHGALLFVVVMTFAVAHALVSSFYPVLSKIEIYQFSGLNLAVWSLVALLINYFSGWRKYKPDFDENLEKFKKVYFAAEHKISREALRFINEFEHDSVKSLGKEWANEATTEKENGGYSGVR